MNYLFVLLVISIFAIILGITSTVFTIGVLKIDMVQVFVNNPALLFILPLLLIAVLALLVYLSVRNYKNHVPKNNSEDNEMVKIDNLTQIYNFDYFINLLEGVEEPFSLVMLDIDNFKYINEKFDPVIGDLVLKVVAKSIKEYIRIDDIVARYQGDAFLIILQKCLPQGAVTLMTVISDSIKNNEKLTDKNISLSTSVGIQYVEGKKSMEVLLRNAVEALCIAKRNGEEDKVVLYEPKENESKISKAQ